MQFITLLSILALLSMALASPTLPGPISSNETALLDMIASKSSKEVNLDGPPDNIGVWICSEPHWMGTCYWSIPVGVTDPYSDSICQKLPFFNSKFLSFGPDSAVCCSLYQTDTCDGGQYWLSWPGYDFMPRLMKTYECRLRAPDQQCRKTD